MVGCFWNACYFFTLKVFMIDFFVQVPVWAWFALLFCIMRGMYALKDRAVSFFSLIIFSSFFLSASLFFMYKKYGISWCIVRIYLLGALLGIGLGMWRILKKQPEVVDASRRIIRIKGSKDILIILLLFFCIKFFNGAMIALYPLYKNNFLLYAIDVASTALLSGFLMGRVIQCWRLLQQGKFVSRY